MVTQRRGRSSASSRRSTSRTPRHVVRAAATASYPAPTPPNMFPAPCTNTSPQNLVAYVSVKSIGGINLFDAKAVISKDNVTQFTSFEKDKHLAAGRLQAMGFEILRVGQISVRVSGPAQLFRKHFGVHFEKRIVAGMNESATPLTPTAPSVGNLLNTGIPEVEGIVFPQPVVLHAPKPTPPKLKYHHLRPPADLVKLLNAGPVHSQGFRGQNVRAAMIDSGFAWKHPYFTAKGYNLKVSLPEDDFTDVNGHGTGESANLLAIAPQVRLHGLSMEDLVEAIQVSRDDLGVQVISNSWGTALSTDGPGGFWDPYWKLVETELLLCQQRGIVIVFSAGNGQVSFTASMSDTVSVGGAYSDKKGNLMASDYASSFTSTRYPGRQVPDVCGLVGMQPQAIYIALPIPAGCVIDKDLGGKPFPAKDETTTTDGWSVFSGTSAACPQVAGVVALILSRHPQATLTEIKQRLSLARDVTQGSSRMGDLAGPGRDLATGHGLVDAAAACA